MPASVSPGFLTQLIDQLVGHKTSPFRERAEADLHFGLLA